MKKNVAIMLAATKDSAFAIANVIIGIERYSSDFVDSIYIYHDGFHEDDMSALSKLSKKIHYILYTHDDFLDKCQFKGNISDTFSRYTHMSVCRYELFNYLKNYRYAIWIDFDILIQKDISFLLDYAPWGMIETNNALEQAVYTLPDNITGKEICLSSGVIVISDKLLEYDKITSQLYHFTSVYAEHLKLPDQAILNYTAILNNIQLKAIPEKLVATPEWKVSLNTAPMVHAAGSKARFWNERSFIIAYPEWQVNNKIWVNLGGSGYEGDIYDRFNIGNSNLAGYFVSKARILNLINITQKKGYFKKGLACEVGIWQEKITIRSTYYINKYLSIEVSLKNKAYINIDAEIDGVIINGDERFFEKLLCLLKLKKRDNVFIFTGSIKDNQLIEVLDSFCNILLKPGDINSITF